MLQVLGVLILIVLVAIFVLIQKNRSGSPSAYKPVSKPTTVKPSKSAPVAADDDEEGTMVRVIGHRLVRLNKGVKVGNEIPVVGSMLVGTDPTCPIRLTEPGVSPRHAEVRLQTGTVMVTDQGSGSGTEINGQKLEPFVPTTLRDNDKILVGSTELLYRAG